MSDYPYTPSEILEEGMKKRYMILRKFRDEEITFDQIIDLSNTKEFSMMNRTSIAVILGSLPGWDKESVRRALISYGLRSNATLGGVKNNESHIETVRYLCNSTSSQWQKRVAAPPGWPWFGNIVATLEKLDEGELPKEISEATRFLTEEEKKNASDPYDTRTEEERTVETPSKTSQDDDLDELLGFSSDDSDDEDDDSDDFNDDLSSLFE